MRDVLPLGLPGPDLRHSAVLCEDTPPGQWSSFWGYTFAGLPVWTRYDLIFVPIIYPRPTPIDAIGYLIDSGTTGNVEWGLYEANQYGLPSDLVFQSPVPGPTSNGAHTVYFEWEAPGGLSYVGVCNQGAADIARISAGYPPFTVLPHLGFTQGGANPWASVNPRTVRIAGVTGGLPAVVDYRDLAVGASGVIPQLLLRTGR